IRQRARGILHHLLQHAAKMRETSFGISRGEQFRAIPERQLDAVRAIRGEQREVELRAARLQLDWCRLRVPETKTCRTGILHREHRAEERRMTGCSRLALKVEDERLDREIRVVEGVQHGR